tara:strand:+ start:688 stop:1074 length:387 start_codon:yes stop_codon:yes gene_type:complete
MSECELCFGNHFIRNEDWTTRPCPVCIGEPENLRTKILNEASDLINGDRQAEYGPPSKNFKSIADIWNAGEDQKIEPWEAALKLAGLKIARLKGPKPSWDSFRDGIGYVALAAELWSQMMRERGDDVS